MHVGLGLGLTRRQGGGWSALQILQSYGAAFFLHDFTRTDLTFQEVGGYTLSDDAGETVAIALSMDQIGRGTRDAAADAKPEIVVNGGPFVNTTGITGISATLSVASSILTITATSSNSGRGEWAVSGLTVGRVYRVVGRVRRKTGTGQQFRAFTWGTIPTTAITIDTFGNYTFNVVATATSGVICIYSSGVTASNDAVDVQSLSMKEVPGNHADQATSTSYRMVRRADGSLRADGIDDHLQHKLIPASTGTILQRSKFNSTSGTQFLVGSQSSSTTQRCAIGLSTKMLARIGPNNAINSEVDPHTDYAVMALAWGVSGETARLYKDGTEIGSVLQTGTLASTNALWSGVINAAGALSSPASIDITHTAYIAARLTPAEIAKIAQEWNAS